MNVPAWRRPAAKRLLANGFALLCLVWVFHDVHPRELWAAMTVTNWWLLLCAIVVDILTYILQGARWKLLLAPVGHIRVLRATQAIYAGLFTNEVLPLRIGEFVRGFLVSRWLPSGISSVVPSMLVERFLDAFWLACGIGVAAMLVHLPSDLLHAGDVLGALVLFATALFLYLVFRKEREAGLTVANGNDVRSRISRFLSLIAGGLQQIGISRQLLGAVVISAGMLFCQVLALWFMMLGCNLRLSLGAAAVVLFIVRLGTAIPNAPANVGSFQFFTVVGLSLFGVGKSTAAGFSVVYFFVLTAPLWIVGLFAISRTGMSISSIRSEAATLARRSIGRSRTQ